MLKQAMVTLDLSLRGQSTMERDFREALTKNLVFRLVSNLTLATKMGSVSMEYQLPYDCPQ